MRSSSIFIQQRHLVPEIRKDFDPLEEVFLAESETVKRGTAREKKEFMDHCFHKALEVTDRWIEQ